MRFTNKFRQEFENFLNSSDVCVFTESHFCKTDLAPDYQNYNSVHKPRKAGQKGGISIYVKKPLQLQIVNVEADELFPVKIFDGQGKLTLLIIGIYFPPTGSVFVRDDNEFFEDLSILIAEMSSQTPSMVVCGDFNARTDQCKMYRSEENTHNRSSFFTEINYENVDFDPIDTRRGQKFIEFCEACCFLPLNGLKSFSKSFPSEFTCIRPQGRSVVDYVLVPDSLVKEVISFTYPEPFEHLSDHAALKVKIKIGTGVTKSRPKKKRFYQKTRCFTKKPASSQSSKELCRKFSRGKPTPIAWFFS